MSTPKACYFHHCLKIRKFCFSLSLFCNKKQVAAVQQEPSKNIRCFSTKFLILQILHLATKSWLCNSLLLILLFSFDQVLTQTGKVILFFHCNQEEKSKNSFAKRKHFLHTGKYIIRATKGYQISVNFTFHKF